MTGLNLRVYEPAFAPLDVLDLARFDGVFPLLLRHYEEIARAGSPVVKVIMPELHVVELCHDKLLFSRHLIERGFGDHVPTIYDQPVATRHIVKPRHGAFGKGCQLADGSDTAVLSSDFFRQELIEGEEEFALHILRQRGRTPYASRIRYRMGGSSDIRSAACIPAEARLEEPGEELALFERILDDLGYSGTCCANYKFRDGRAMILELNPRFGGSLVHDVTRYVDAYLAALES